MCLFFGLDKDDTMIREDTADQSCKERQNCYIKIGTFKSYSILINNLFHNFYWLWKARIYWHYIVIYTGPLA